MKKSPLTHIAILIAFLINTLGPIPSAQADEFVLPKAGVRVHLSPPMNPAMLKGIKVHPNNPFQFDFILDQGDIVARKGQDTLKEEANRLIKYFLASLTIPEHDLWVNLSPYEKDRIIPESFGLTEMGRDLLAEDYMLKQITASLIYPEDEIGKKFWRRVYQEASAKYGTTNIPVNTFNKVWIVPQKAVVYENAKAGTAYVVESKLKVMLEEDYLAGKKVPGTFLNDAHTLGNQIIREIVLPELSKEVNENQNFAQLRQVYNSLILATWYKKKIKDSILSQVYADKNKTAGININDPQQKEKIYQQYLQAFKKGVYNYIKEEQDPITQQPIPRKYFSGGFGFAGQMGQVMKTVDTISDEAMTGTPMLVSAQIDQAMPAKLASKAGLEPLQISTGTLYPQEGYIQSFMVNVAPTIRERDKILEIGTGSGILTRRLAQSVQKYQQVEFVATDIEANAIADATQNLSGLRNVQVRQGNLFEPIKEDEKFDIIFWNPPWLDKQVNRKEGSALVDEGYASLRIFFEQVKAYLRPQGRVYIIFEQSNSGVLYELAQANHLNIEALRYADVNKNSTSVVYEFTPQKEESPTKRNKVIGFFPGMGSYKAYQNVKPDIYHNGGEEVKLLYEQAASILGLFKDGKPDPEQLFINDSEISQERKLIEKRMFASILVHNLALQFEFIDQNRRRDIPVEFDAFASDSLGTFIAAVASGALSLKDALLLIQRYSEVKWQTIEATGNKTHYVYYLRSSDIVSRLEELNRQFGEDFLVFRFAAEDEVSVYVAEGIQEEFIGMLQRLNILYRQSNGSTVSVAHSRRLKEGRGVLEDFVNQQGIQFRNPRIPIISSDQQGYLRTADQVKEALLRNLSEAAYSQNMLALVEERGASFIVEFSPEGRTRKNFIEKNKVQTPFYEFIGDKEHDRSVLEAMKSQVDQETAKDNAQLSNEEFLAHFNDNKRIVAKNGEVYEVSAQEKFSDEVDDLLPRVKVSLKRVSDGKEFNKVLVFAVFQNAVRYVYINLKDTRDISGDGIGSALYQLLADRMSPGMVLSELIQNEETLQKIKSEYVAKKEKNVWHVRNKDTQEEVVDKSPAEIKEGEISLQTVLAQTLMGHLLVQAGLENLEIETSMYTGVRALAEALLDSIGKNAGSFNLKARKPTDNAMTGKLKITQPLVLAQEIVDQLTNVSLRKKMIDQTRKLWQKGNTKIVQELAKKNRLDLSEFDPEQGKFIVKKGPTKTTFEETSVLVLLANHLDVSGLYQAAALGSYQDIILLDVDSGEVLVALREELEHFVNALEGQDNELLDEIYSHARSKGDTELDKQSKQAVNAIHRLEAWFVRDNSKTKKDREDEAVAELRKILKLLEKPLGEQGYSVSSHITDAIETLLKQWKDLRFTHLMQNTLKEQQDVRQDRAASKAKQGKKDGVAGYVGPSRTRLKPTGTDAAMAAQQPGKNKARSFDDLISLIRSNQADALRGIEDPRNWQPKNDDERKIFNDVKSLSDEGLTNLFNELITQQVDMGDKTRNHPIFKSVGIQPGRNSLKDFIEKLFQDGRDYWIDFFFNFVSAYNYLDQVPMAENVYLAYGKGRAFIHEFTLRMEHLDQAMVGLNKDYGGINFNADQMDLQVQNQGGSIKFNLEPGMFQELQNAPGFVPVIINIQPMKDLRSFLGVREELKSSQLQMV